MAEKRRLYLDEGAQEVWVCDEEGRLRFFNAEGERSRSAPAPDTSASIDV